SASIGYFAGHALYYSIVWFGGVDMSEWLTYVFGGVLAVVLFVLSFKKFSYMMYTVMAVIGYSIALFYTNGSQRVAIGAAILLGLLSMFAVRFVFILLTSFAGSAVLMGSLSALLPAVELLQLSETNYLSLLIALGVIVVFMIVQLLITRTKREKIAKEEKEKKAKKKKKSQKRTDDEDVVVMTTPGIQSLVSGKFFK
ncbi:MAG: hypothetical protein IJW92_02450, partial [Clostridia bacterium]|nr:hypothetical protein [Clostridia bacterium]